MKKTTKIMVLALCAIMTATVLGSCSKENNSHSQNVTQDTYQTRIIGKWQMTRRYEHYPSGESEHVAGEIWIFNSDGIVTRQDASGTQAVEYSYSISGNTLVILLGYQIVELTNTTMILHFEVNNSTYEAFEFKKYNETQTIIDENG